MMGLEPTTFCMASRRSSQLSYIRVGASIAAVAGGSVGSASRVERVVDELVGERVVLSAHGGVADGVELAREPRGPL
jgi:hypothetical protein